MLHNMTKVNFSTWLSGPAQMALTLLIWSCRSASGENIQPTSKSNSRQALLKDLL